MPGRRLITLLAMGVWVALIALVLSACSGGSKEKGASGGPPPNGQIVFRRYLDPDQAHAALFTMNSDRSHVRQITHPPMAGGTSSRCGPPMGRRSPSTVRRSTRA
jgi:hypothetical protein